MHYIGDILIVCCSPGYQTWNGVPVLTLRKNEATTAAIERTHLVFLNLIFNFKQLIGCPPIGGHLCDATAPILLVEACEPTGPFSLTTSVAVRLRGRLRAIA